MRKYEGLFIFPPEEGPEAAKEGEARLEEMITRFGGKIVNRQDWGRRPLGYALRKFREGRILQWNFELETQQLIELRRALDLSERFLKTNIVKHVTPKPPKESKKKARAPRPPVWDNQPPRKEEETSHGRQF